MTPFVQCLDKRKEQNGRTGSSKHYPKITFEAN